MTTLSLLTFDRHFAVTCGVLVESACDRSTPHCQSPATRQSGGDDRGGPPKGPRIPSDTQPRLLPTRRQQHQGAANRSAVRDSNQLPRRNSARCGCCPPAGSQPTLSQGRLPQRRRCPTRRRCRSALAARRMDRLFADPEISGDRIEDSMTELGWITIRQVRPSSRASSTTDLGIPSPWNQAQTKPLTRTVTSGDAIGRNRTGRPSP